MITTNNVDLPWYKSLCRLKECHPLLFRCSLLFVVLNNDLILFAAVTAKMLLQWAASSAFAVPWYCGLHQQHARGHCRLAVHMCTSTSTWTTMQKYKLKLTKQKFKSALNQPWCFLYFVYLLTTGPASCVASSSFPQCWSISVKHEHFQKKNTHLVECCDLIDYFITSGSEITCK